MHIFQATAMSCSPNIHDYTVLHLVTSPICSYKWLVHLPNINVFLLISSQQFNGFVDNELGSNLKRYLHANVSCRKENVTRVLCMFLM